MDRFEEQPKEPTEFSPAQPSEPQTTDRAENPLGDKRPAWIIIGIIVLLLLFGIAAFIADKCGCNATGVRQVSSASTYAEAAPENR